MGLDAWGWMCRHHKKFITHRSDDFGGSFFFFFTFKNNMEAGSKTIRLHGIGLEDQQSMRYFDVFDVFFMSLSYYWGFGRLCERNPFITL